MTISEHLRRRIQEAKDKQLETLDLTYGNLTQIPDEVFELTHLKVLILRLNQIQNLSNSISRLSNLTRLDLSANKISTLFNSISRLSNLTTLDLSYNQLSSLPDCITKISSLIRLYLSKNQISTLPNSISKLSNLTTLDLADNQLLKLPNSITNLSNLTRLDLGENQLNILPQNISNLSNLTRLDLSNNQLTSLPKSITNFSNSLELYLGGNPLEIPPLEVANRGIKAIREYFRQIIEEGKDHIYEAKLLIVGEAGAGKTSLAKKIENSEYQLDTNEKSTEGIDITTWSFPLNHKQEFKVNIWDFGGQAIYHATHQFFLTKRSLYALVADTRKEDTDFYYWLNVVELLSDNSPLLIVKNEKDDRQREINERGLRGQFTNFQETLATNLKTNRGLDKILLKIQHYIQDLPIVRQELPKTWVQVRKSLEDDPRNHISLQEYLDICQINGFTCLKDKLQLSEYLHDLGVCLHFQGEENSLLYRTVILKPEWVTDAVYKVLDNLKVINHQGCFTCDDLKTIWHEDKYSSMRGELLELMKKFQLCYQIPDSKDTFIAPQLLSDNQADYDWDESNNLILRYTYPDFMPKGIISRFIVIMHQYIHSHNDYQYVWKSGVLLEKDNTFAEVIEYYGKREIKISAFGNNKRDCMTIITHELDKINNSYKRLKYQKLIPCNCSKCKNQQEPYFHPFDVLQNAKEQRQRKVQCQKSFQMVDVLSLIDDVIIWNDHNQEEERPSQASPSRNVHIHIDQGDHALRASFADRHTNIEKGNYNENIKGDYYDQKENNNTISNINQSRNLNISGNAQVNTSGAASFNLGDISGTVANTINQLPSFDNEPNKQELKELLTQLQTAVLETDLDPEEQEESLEQIQAIAESLQDSQDGAVKKTAKRAMKLLRGTAAALPPTTSMVTICNQLPDLIGKVF